VILSSEITDHKGRLLREILEGQLLLKATGLVRYNFVFSIGERQVGIYGIRSYGKKKIRAIRAWNRSRDSWDPIKGLFIPTPGRQFGRIHAETPLFLVEFNQAFDKVVDKIAFRAGKVKVKDAELPSTQPELRFEEVDFENLEILG
jgi:hypothetical protein